MKTFIGFIPLTSKELNCLHRCAEGRLDAEIAAEFELTSKEAAFLLEIATRKLKCPNRMAALARAATLGLFEPSVMAEKGGQMLIHGEMTPACEGLAKALQPYRDGYLQKH